MAKEAPKEVVINGQRMRVLGRGLHAKRGVRVTLRVLRVGGHVTQADLAERSSINQADISRLEAKTNFDDCTVATLRRYIEALGGKLELVATFDKHKFTIVGVE